MSRKRGLVGIFLVILLYFAAGVITARFINAIDSRLDIPFKEYVIAGLASLFGYLYWFLVVRLGGKSLKKLIFGRA